MSEQQKKRAGILRRFFRGDATPNLPAENPFQKQERVISGRRLITRDEAEEMADIEDADTGLSFGGIRVSSETHAIICGQTRSGKTTLLKQQMAEALRRVKKGSDERAVIFDASGEFIPFVYAIMGDDAPIVILDPVDERCFAWDVSTDITDALQAANLVEMLIPKEEHDEAFFLSGARGVTKAVLEKYLIRAEEEKESGGRFSWTLRDVFNAMDTKAAVIDVLRYPTRKQLKNFETEIEKFVLRQNQDILSTIGTKSSKEILVAAMWDKRPTISAAEFIESTDGKVIIITNSSKTSAIVKELNRLFFEMLAQALLDGENLSGKRTHIFLDEFAEMGKLEALKNLLKMGLKKGVRVYLCYQNFEEVKEIYGEEQAEVILSESGTIAFLRQHGKSAQAASEFIGMQTVIITNQSSGISSGEQGSTIQQGKNESREKRPTVVAEDFTKELPKAGQKNGVSGFFFSPSVPDVWKHCSSWEEIGAIASAKSNNPMHAPQIRRQGIDYQFLRPWTKDEREKFRGKPQEDHSKTAQTAAVEKETAPVQATPPAQSAEFDLQKYTDQLKETFFNRDEFIASVQRHEQERGS